MTWELYFVFALLALALVSFLRERIAPDHTAIMLFGLLLVVGALPFAENLPRPGELLTVFANPAPLAIAAMFMISAALEKSGLIDHIARGFTKSTQLGFRGFLLAMVLAVATASAFVNNTPIVVVFLPVILSLSRKLRSPASKLLIPLSYASIMGGTCTLVGTSVNLLASGILSGHETTLADGSVVTQAPLGMFEIGAVGLPMLLVGAAYLTFLAPRLLPHRETLTSILSDEERREYLMEAIVQRESPLVGKHANELDLLKSRNVRLVEIIRNGVRLLDDIRKVPLQAADRLVLAARPSGFARARETAGLDLDFERALGVETIASHEGHIVEGVVGPNSRAVGHTIREINFRQRYRMLVLAIHRHGLNLRGPIEDQPLQFGDTLLLMGTDPAREELRRGEDILLLDRPATPSKQKRRSIPVTVAVLAGIVGSVTLGVLPMVAAAIGGCAVLLATGVIKPKEGYAAIDWSILVLIYSMLGLGLAMERSGASGLIAGMLARVADLGVPVGMQLTVLVAALFLLTSICTEFLSNQATVVLMTPIALGLGTVLGIDPRPLAVTVCLASSASFATPIGYQTNTYVYSVGGYRFADFARVGLPLNFIYLVGATLLIPRIWG